MSPCTLRVLKEKAENNGRTEDMIKAVIFDIDNTMYDFDGAHQTAMDALAAYMK